MWKQASKQTLGASTSEFISLDIETTGLDAVADEILQLAIVDQAGHVLFNDTFSGEHTTSWPRAQMIHGIAPKDVQHKEPIGKRLAEIQRIVDAYQVLIIYNADFDSSFLKNCGINLKDKDMRCLMRLFAPIYGKRKRDKKGLRFSIEAGT